MVTAHAKRSLGFNRELFALFEKVKLSGSVKVLLASVSQTNLSLSLSIVDRVG